MTHSAAHLDQVAQTVDATGLNFLPNQAAGGGSLSAYLQGNTETPISATRYEQLVAIEYTNNDPFIVSLFGADSKVYSLRDSPASAPPVKLKPVAQAWFLVWLRICRMLGMHLIWTAHNVLPHSPVFANDVSARRALMKASNLVLAHSQSTLAELAALGAVARRTAVIQHGPFNSRRYQPRCCVIRAEQQAPAGFFSLAGCWSTRVPRGPA